MEKVGRGRAWVQGEAISNFGLRDFGLRDSDKPLCASGTR
jgi:hypothetical protein